MRWVWELGIIVVIGRSLRAGNWVKRHGGGASGGHTYLDTDNGVGD